MFNHLPEANRLELDLYELYPELYSLDYSFDKGHLNQAGAEIFSRKFAEIARVFLER